MDRRLMGLVVVGAALVVLVWTTERPASAPPSSETPGEAEEAGGPASSRGTTVVPPPGSRPSRGAAPGAPEEPAAVGAPRDAEPEGNLDAMAGRRGSMEDVFVGLIATLPPGLRGGATQQLDEALDALDGLQADYAEGRRTALDVLSASREVEQEAVQGLRDLGAPDAADAAEEALGLEDAPAADWDAPVGQDAVMDWLDEE